VTYRRSITGLVVIDPYNDFISEGGKVWDRLKGVATANGCVPHMIQVLEATRHAGIQVLYALHHRYRPGDIVAQEHWCSSGFANTDLDLLLKRHGIQQLIMMGLIAHTCLEATVRFGAELGYEVTVVKDATASYSDEEMHAALEINIPNYATAILSAEEIVDAISNSTA
jgi:ureidoacrylate peracid hydrolase